MPVFHCPLCPLIFEYRTEVEYHLRNEHPSRADEEARLAAQVCAAGTDLDWGRLRALQSSRAGTAVSLIMPTTPGPVMSTLDVARIRRLAQQARRRLAAEPGPVPPTIEARLSRAVVAAESYATQEGIVILVNAQELAIFRLPFEPVERVVIDPNFATRDLETTLQCYPRYRLVVLGRHPRLLEGRGLHLVEVDDDGPFQPATSRAATRPWGGKRSARPERWSIRRARRAAAIRHVDQLLGSQAETNDNLPLIIAGDGRSRGHFRRYSQHAASVMGEISGIRTKDSVSTLGRLAQPHLMRRLQEEQAAAKAELDRADAHGLIDWGLQAAWAGVQDGSADRVWVEQSFARPGRPADDPTKVELLSDPTQPGINDDLVDDLIESATKKGIHVHLLAARTIGRPEPIAVRKRARVPTTETPLEVAQAV